jgi:hypothetical protein
MAQRITVSAENKPCTAKMKIDAACVMIPKELNMNARKYG